MASQGWEVYRPPHYTKQATPAPIPLGKGVFGGRGFEQIPHNKKGRKSIDLRPFCGMDGTRTRDLLRDRQAF